MVGEKRFIREASCMTVSAEECAAARVAGERIVAAGRIGLVLGGGGAKGAYQIGCWKALRESGIVNFDAVAGTSVGALNAVLIAQDEFGKAESIWHDMSFGRVLRFRWQTLLALTIRVVLLPVFLGKILFSPAFPASAIPVALWRAIREDEADSGDPVQLLLSALKLYSKVLANPRTSDLASWVALAIVVVLGASAWRLLGVPILTLVLLFVALPVATLVLLSWAAWAASALDFLSTRLVLATNQPLHQLLLDCVSVSRLQNRTAPVFVTLASLRAVSRTSTQTFKPKLEAKVVSGAAADALQLPPSDKPPTWWKKNITGEGDSRRYASAASGLPVVKSTVEYVPAHFDVRKYNPALVTELILQSAGLPEIFPARRFGGRTYVDGGVVDNEPLAALAERERLSTIVVIPLDAKKDEAGIGRDLAANLERMGLAPAATAAPLLVLTPSRPLGGFLFGTLGFRAARCQSLMQMGYCDTIRKLANSEI
jgi:hypothetical protein